MNRSRAIAALAALVLALPAAAQTPKYTLGVRGGYTSEGMRIDAVVPGSPAEKVGLQKGDTILKIDGQPVLNQQDFVTAIDGSHGSAILIVRKGSNPRPVRLIADLVGAGQNRWTHGPYLLGVLGTFTPQGMRINHVVPGTPAERIGLRRDDVIVTIGGQPVRNQNEFFSVLNSSGGSATLMVRRGPGGQLTRLEADLATHQLGVVGEFTRDGLRIEVVAPGTPAERYGLQRGDLVMRVENQVVKNMNELNSVLANSGGTATLLVRRPPAVQPGRLLVDLTNNPLGAWCEPVADGMRVTSVAPGTPAERIGLERGDLIVKIDDRPVRSQGELNAALFNSGGFAALFVRKAATGRVVRLEADLAR